MRKIFRFGKFRWLSEFAAGFSASSSAPETDNAKRFYGRNDGKTDCRLPDCRFLSAQTNAFIACVERDWQKRLGDSVPVSKLSEKELMDAKQLALALRRDKRNRFKSVRDYQQSAVLSFKGNSAPYALRAQDAVERYLSAALAG